VAEFSKPGRRSPYRLAETAASKQACKWLRAGRGNETHMADIGITSTGTREFQVAVRDTEGGETSHHVTVPESLIEKLDLPADDLERIVRESFEFLLEREPASSIMSEFSLDVISSYFPEYEQELPRRLS